MYCPHCGLQLNDGTRFCSSCGGALPEFPLLPDTLLDGERYRVLKLLKSGGMGAVYRCRDQRLDKEVALKQLLPGCTEGYYKERFDAEGSWLSKLSHPALPRVTDTFEREGCRFHVMDLIPGQDLEAHLEQHGPLPLPKAREVSLQLLEVLRFLHGLDPPVIYRDLKPSNVILGEDGKVSLVDFGLARAPSGATETAIGTEGYCPLEQYQGKAEPRSDLYAMGATLYHLVTGRTPQPLRYEPPGPEVPAFLEKILARAMALLPQDRFADAEQMRRAVEAWDQAAAASEDGATQVEVAAGPALVGPRESRRQVDLPAYRIDLTPVTQAQYQAFVKATGYQSQGEWERWARPERAQHPVVGVTWKDALEYCRWAKKRLPTEEEWEKAARGSDGRDYPWGNSFEPSRCHHGSSQDQRAARLVKDQGTVPVGLLPAGASPCGCLDMAGNVWEWTASEGSRPGTRVLKGGCWANRDPQALAAWARLEAAADSCDCRRGFRGVGG